MGCIETENPPEIPACSPRMPNSKFGSALLQREQSPHAHTSAHSGLKGKQAGRPAGDAECRRQGLTCIGVSPSVPWFLRGAAAGSAEEGSDHAARVKGTWAETL